MSMLLSSCYPIENRRAGDSITSQMTVVQHGEYESISLFEYIDNIRWHIFLSDHHYSNIDQHAKTRKEKGASETTIPVQAGSSKENAA